MGTTTIESLPCRKRLATKTTGSKSGFMSTDEKAPGKLATGRATREISSTYIDAKTTDDKAEQGEILELSYSSETDSEEGNDREKLRDQTFEDTRTRTKF